MSVDENIGERHKIKCNIIDINKQENKEGQYRRLKTNWKV